MPTAEQLARANIDQLLTAAGWHLCDYKAADIHAARGVALREFELSARHGKAAVVIEANPERFILSGVETQSEKYTKGLSPALPAWHSPLPFAYQSTGIETRFINGLDPEPRARAVFAFHRSEFMASWPKEPVAPDAKGEGETGRIREAPTLCEAGFREREHLVNACAAERAGHWRLAQGCGAGRLRGGQDYVAKMVGIVREGFAAGNKFAQKITYRTTDKTPRPFE